MKLWLDDQRHPAACGALGFVWAKTLEEAIGYLETGEVTFASLDHDLTPRASLGYWEGEPTGLDLCKWMQENNRWPPDGVAVHSHNFEGARQMRDFVQKCGIPLEKPTFWSEV